MDKEPMKPKIADEVRMRLMEIAVKATAEERKMVSEIIARAQQGDYGTELLSYSPAMAALIFLEHNPHNRDWRPAWTLELSRRMKAGQWRRNNALSGFYTNGQCEDGQHRFAAAALAGITWDTLTVFGISTAAISSVDAGMKRYGSDAAKLDGVHNTKTKESILRTASNYMVKIGDKSAAIISESEMADAIKAKSRELDTAIDISGAAAQNLVTPILKPLVAASISYLMLQHGWPEHRVREKLALINSGQSSGGEAEPFFVAGELISKSRTRTDAKERLNTLKEVGLVILVMGMTEEGTVATRKATLISSIRKALPDPTYKPQDTAKAA